MQPDGINKCIYCGAKNPDSESTCPTWGGNHTLVAASDKEVQGQGPGEYAGPSDHPAESGYTPENQNWKNYKKKSNQVRAYRVLAHGFQPGDDAVIRHCPLCGSGDIWGKSDGNTHCEFCGKDFTVQLQPEYPQMAQNIDGAPMDIDGNVTPGDNPVGQPPGEPLQGMDAQSGAQSGDEEGSPADEEDQGKVSGDPDIEQQNSGGTNSGGTNPFTSSLLLTKEGNVLSREHMVDYLAIRHASNRERILAQLRERNTK